MIHARRHESGISPSRVRRSVRLYRVSTSSLLVHFLTVFPLASTARHHVASVLLLRLLLCHPSFLPPSDARLALCSARVRSFLVRESRDEATWLTSSSPLSLFFFFFPPSFRPLFLPLSPSVRMPLSSLLVRVSSTLPTLCFFMLGQRRGTEELSRLRTPRVYTHHRPSASLSAALFFHAA